MKYKHNLIQHIKNTYGVPDLYFFKGIIRADINNPKHRQMWYGSVIICSPDPDIDKKYKASNNAIQINSQLTHHELEKILQTLSDNSRFIHKGDPTIHSPILVEPYGIEVNDLISLKSAYLLTYLAGI